MALDIPSRKESSGFCIFIVYEQITAQIQSAFAPSCSTKHLVILTHFLSNQPLTLVAGRISFSPKSSLSFHDTFFSDSPKEGHCPLSDLPCTTSTCLCLYILCLCSREADQLIGVLSIRGHLLTFPFPSAQMYASEVCGCLC